MTWEICENEKWIITWSSEAFFFWYKSLEIKYSFINKETYSFSIYIKHLSRTLKK